jgi:hypothetical protein
VHIGYRSNAVTMITRVSSSLVGGGAAAAGPAVWQLPAEVCLVRISCRPSGSAVDSDREDRGPRILSCGFRECRSDSVTPQNLGSSGCSRGPWISISLRVSFRCGDGCCHAPCILRFTKCVNRSLPILQSAGEGPRTPVQLVPKLVSGHLHRSHSGH